ncbi:hypothetical protein C8R45DRAFT_940356 [Mycena sanguinolenta]|nr:hypothetical protein C8R45DRAFT_940356 [Mycena sanguinolenta]
MSSCVFCRTRPARAPMLLSAICRDWREIALSTPSLWCSFILSVNLVKIVDGSAVIRLFETWLSRGGNCPLTMVINGVASSSAKYTLPASFILALSQSSSRWRDVNLMLPLTDFYRLNANEGLAQLKRLSITATANTAGVNSESPLPPLGLFSTAPLLQDICLGYGFSLDNITLPLHQLACFESRASAPAAHYLRVACTAPGLQEIRLNLNTSGTWGRSDPVRSNIKVLHLLSMTEEDNDILDCLTCPALETLVIHGLYNPILPHPLTPFHFPGLHRFFGRSSASLRELVLEFPPNLPDAFVETVQTLTALPTLERLDIQPLAGNTAHEIFTRMCDSTVMFLPRLRILTVQVNVCQIRTLWTYDAMTRMLVARWNKQVGKEVEQLQVFTFGFSPVFWASEFRPFPQPDSATLEQLRSLTRRGMDIELVTDAMLFTHGACRTQIERQLFDEHNVGDVVRRVMKRVLGRGEACRIMTDVRPYGVKVRDKSQQSHLVATHKSFVTTTIKKILSPALRVSDAAFATLKTRSGPSSFMTFSKSTYAYLVVTKAWLRVRDSSVGDLAVQGPSASFSYHFECEPRARPVHQETTRGGRIRNFNAQNPPELDKYH